MMRLFDRYIEVWQTVEESPISAPARFHGPVWRPMTSSLHGMALVSAAGNGMALLSNRFGYYTHARRRLSVVLKVDSCAGFIGI